MSDKPDNPFGNTDQLEIASLKAENKALKEDKHILTKQIVSLTVGKLELEESRDELLEAVSQSEIVFRNTGDVDKAKMLTPIIKKAEAIKEKE